jgi:polar amino acid transport system substrate-binding protein
MFLLFMLPTEVPAADTLTVVSDQWRPYSCVPGSDMPGSTVEVVQAIFEPKGTKVVYRTMPYEEVLKETKAGKYNAVLNGGRKEFEGWIVSEEESGIARFMAFVKKGNPWRYTGLESLAGKRLGVVQGYRYDQGGKLDTWIADNSRSVVAVSGDNPLEILQQKILLGEVDVVIDDAQAFNFVANAKKLNDKFQEAGLVHELPVYIGFSPARPESQKYAEIFTQGIRELRRSMKLAEILKKYGVSDWKK